MSWIFLFETSSHIGTHLLITEIKIGRFFCDFGKNSLHASSEVSPLDHKNKMTISCEEFNLEFSEVLVLRYCTA